MILYHRELWGFLFCFFWFFLIFEKEMEDFSLQLVRIKFIWFPDWCSLVIYTEPVAHLHPFDHKKCFPWKCSLLPGVMELPVGEIKLKIIWKFTFHHLLNPVVWLKIQWMAWRVRENIQLFRLLTHKAVKLFLCSLDYFS